MANKKSNKKNPKQVINQPDVSVIPEHPKPVSANFRIILLLGFIAFIAYANTIKNDYALDDYTVIKGNTIITKGISAIPEILSTPYRRGYFITSNDQYRPLSLVMFAAEYEFFGLNPMPGHFINVLLFAGCVILLFLFFDRLFDQKNTAVAFIAALLFALHPIHTEVVANIKSRDELLCFFFAFLCLNVFMKYIKTGKTKQLILGSLCFFLSLLSKETAITFIIAIPLIFFFINNENKTRSLKAGIGTIAAVVAFLIIRYSVLSFYHADTSAINFIDNPLAKEGLSFESRIATAVLILGYYIRLLFVPYPLISDYSYNSVPFVHFSDPMVLISLALYIFLIVFSIRRFLKSQKDPYAIGILFFLITISLMSNIVFLIGTNMGERLMFFPSVGFCLVLALLIKQLAVKPEQQGPEILLSRNILGITIPICLIYGVITFNRNNEWKDNYTLIKTDVEKAPNGSKLNYFLGFLLEQIITEKEKDPAKQKKIRAEAISYIKKGLAIYPDNGDAQTDMGYSYLYNEQYDSAEVHLKRAIELTPANLNAINNLAKVYFLKQKYTLAIEQYKKAILLKGDDVTQYANLGVCYFYLGKYDSAIYYSYKAVAIDPGYKASYETLAVAYKVTGKTDSSGKYETIAKKNNPKFKL